MKATRRPFTSVPRASRGPSCMLLKQGITGLRMSRAIQELDPRAGHIVPGPGLPPERSKNERA